LLELKHSMIDFTLSNNLRNYFMNYKNLKKKVRDKNIFFVVPKDIQKQLLDNICKIYPEFRKYNWSIEVGKFYDPVGWHNDYNYDANTKLQCKKGFIIPLKWYKNAGTQFTEYTFNKKIVIKEDEKFQVVDTGEFLNENILEHINEFITYKWQENKIITFSSDVLHRATPSKYNRKYKLSINALGYVK